MRPDRGASGSLPVVIVGAGRVGSSLAIDLARVGRFGPITVVCRSDPGPLRSSRLTALDVALVRASEETGVPTDPPAGTAAEAGGGYVLAFCVADDRLEETAAAWASACGTAMPAPSIGLHTSGLHDASAIGVLRRLGTAVASCHPLVAIATPGNGRFLGVTFGIDGDPGAVDLSTELATSLGGRPRRIRPDARALYHLAAVFGSNFPVACLAVASEILAGSLDPPGDPADALVALFPLARSALENLDREGLPEGMTGAVVRGDAGTVRRHLAALDPGRRDLYRALASELLAVREDRLGAGALADLRRALEPGEGVDAESEGGASDGE